MKSELFSKFIFFRSLSLQNAEDALKSAEYLRGKNVNHISYHLSLLALEEIGKIFMFWMKVNRKETSLFDEQMNIEMDDHPRKLFFAIWAPSIGTELITKEQMEESRFMASTLHENRINSLYGDTSDIIISANKIKDEEVNQIIDFTKARLNLAKTEGEINEDEEPSTNWKWLMLYLEKPSGRNIVFGKTAQKKLIELNDANEWIQWLKVSYESEQTELLDLTKKELVREQPTDGDVITPKWEITFTITTPSHSTRPNVLTAINKFERPIKLLSTKDKHTIIIKSTLGTNVSLKDIWDVGWNSCKLFVASLNIGANGIFYWNTVINTERYQDYITDLESNKRLDARLVTPLTFDWKEQKLVLTEQNLHLAFIAYEYLVQIQDMNEARPIHEYLSAIGMLAKTDIHLRLEVSVFLSFYEAFLLAIKTHENISTADIIEIGYFQIQGMQKDKEEFNEIMKLAKELQEKNTLLRYIAYKDVLAIKRYCEYYFLTIAVRRKQNDKTIRLRTTNNSEVILVQKEGRTHNKSIANSGGVGSIGRKFTIWL